MITVQNSYFFRDFMQSLFEELKRMGIEYCVERNYERLPYHTDNDVDIYVQEDQFSKFHNILLEVAKLRGWVLIMYAKSYGGSRYYFGQVRFRQIMLLHIDVTFKLNWRGLEFISAKHVLASKVPYNTFYIPGAGAEAATLLLSRFIHHGYIKDAYKECIRNLVAKEPHVFSNIIRATFGQKWAAEFLEKVSRADWEGIESKSSALRRQLLFTNLYRHPIRQSLNWLNYLVHMGQRLFNPIGFFAVLLGPDGSGKSTVASQLALTLETIFPPGKSRTLHWRPGLLPPIRRLFGQRNKIEAEDFIQPHRAKPHGWLVSLLRFLYYTTDFILGYYLKVYFMKAKGTLVIMDRYYYDFLVDAYRYRFNLPTQLFRFFLKIIPKPDLAVYLHNSPEVLRKQKAELLIEELKRQVEAFQRLVLELPNAHKVSANCPLDEVVHEVTSIILDFMAQRAKKRLR